jgi:hypothetical protein
MLILVACLLFFLAAVTLITLKIFQPNARYAWLVASGGGILSLLSVFLWMTQLPITLQMFTWQPQSVFRNPIVFQADDLRWAYAFSLAALTLAVLLTAVARLTFTSSYAWAGSLALGVPGLLAMTASNSLTLLLIWGALDIAELLIEIRTAEGVTNTDKVVASFFTRVMGIGILLWASVVSVSQGGTFDFASMPPATGLYLIIAAGLRLGVLPLHLPYSAESTLRRGFGTSLLMVSTASSLVLLSHIPAASLNTPLTSFLMILACIAAIYGGWMWLRAPEELTGRPYWIIGAASLSVIAALNGNSTGAVAWGCALVLAGASLFLSSVHNTWLNRGLLIGAFSLSSLPFSLTASTWQTGVGIFFPFVIISQALLIAGHVRHALRPGGKDTLDSQPNWTRTVYPIGTGLLITAQLLLGLMGWRGALQVGSLIYSLPVTLLALILIWATPRFRVLNPIRANWLGPASTRIANFTGFFPGLYRALGRLGTTINSTLEGDGGVMWTLLFLVLFVSLMTQGAP